MRINPFFLSAALIVVAAGCKPGGGGTGSDDPGAKAIKPVEKLTIDDKTVGTGAPVVKGDELWVRYTGTLMNGKVFDSNRKEGKLPFHVTVGEGQVIAGWDQGLLGMKVGGKRILKIPSQLAYGEKGQPPSIPPDSDLIFDVELLSVLKKEDAGSISANDVKVGHGREAKDGDVITISYTATANGEEFENRPSVTFKIGADEMAIDGFDKALKGMKVGGERKVTIPPALTRTVRSDKLGMNVGVWDVTLKSIQ